MNTMVTVVYFFGAAKNINVTFQHVVKSSSVILQPRYEPLPMGNRHKPQKVLTIRKIVSWTPHPHIALLRYHSYQCTIYIDYLKPI